MDDKEILTVPYVAYESAITRDERTIKRLYYIICIIIVCFLVSNLAWLYMWNQYDYISDESSIEMGTDIGNNNYIGNDGDINYGTDESD